MLRMTLRPLRRQAQFHLTSQSVSLPTKGINSRVTHDPSYRMSAETAELCAPFFPKRDQTDNKELSVDLYCKVLLQSLLSHDLKASQQLINRLAEVNQNRPDELISQGSAFKTVYETMERLNQDTSIWLDIFEQYHLKVKFYDTKNIEHYVAVANDAFSKELLQALHASGLDGAHEWLMDNLKTLAARLRDEGEDSLLVAIRWLPALRCLAESFGTIELTKEQMVNIASMAEELETAIQRREDLVPPGNAAWSETLSCLRRFLRQLQQQETVAEETMRPCFE